MLLPYDIGFCMWLIIRARLVTNTFASEVIEPSERTAVFGRLAGCVMFGTAVGYLCKYQIIPSLYGNKS